jgi:hypothetical protein
MRKQAFMIGFLILTLVCFAFTVERPSGLDPPQQDELVIDQRDVDQVTLPNFIDKTVILLNAEEVEISYGDYTAQTLTIQFEGLNVNNSYEVMLVETLLGCPYRDEAILSTTSERLQRLKEGAGVDYSVCINYAILHDSKAKMLNEDFDFSMNKLLMQS